MRPLLLLLAFLTTAARADEPLVLSQLRCATLLQGETTASAPEATADAFRITLLKLGEIPEDESLPAGSPAAFELDRPAREGVAAAKARLREAFRLADARKTARLRRTVVVGADAIRDHVIARGIALEEALRQYEAAPAAKKDKPGVSPLAASAHSWVSGSTGFKIGTLGLISWRQAHKGHLLVAGAAAAAAAAVTVPLVKISGTSIYTFVRQAGINRGWFEPVRVAARLAEDDGAHDERILRTLAGGDTSDVVFRGERFRIGLRRTEEFDLLFRKRLPTFEAIKKATFDRKGQPPAVDDRLIDWDEVLLFNDVTKNWELHALVHEVR